MSKIGRKPISLGGVKVSVDGSVVRYEGKFASGEHAVPACLVITLDQDLISVAPGDNAPHDVNRIWGLHRALLANKIGGAHTKFETKVKIVGLGYKAIPKGKEKIEFTLGYSHKINFDLPKDVDLDVDRTGQNLTFRSPDKELLGHVCSRVCSLRPVEPYKGTGVYLANTVVRRKAGKAKAA